MLEELHIANLALIDDVTLEFGPGLTVLTGETGAGKTVLLSALKLLIGDRADASAVRHGAEEALVEARFATPDELVVSRRIAQGGRSKATLNGAMATVANLTETVGPSVDLHGQHEHQALVRPATHVGYLDRFGGSRIDEPLRSYRAARTSYLAADEQVRAVRESLDRSAEELEVNRLILAEIDRVDPQPGEDDGLREALPAMRHAEEIAEATAAARDALQGDGGAADSLAAAVATLERVSAHVPAIAATLDELRQAQVTLDEGVLSLREVARATTFDNAELERAQSRLAALDGLTKRFGPSLGAVIERRERLRATTELVESGGDALERAEQELARTRAELGVAAAALARARAEVAREFTAQVLAECAGLELGNIGFNVSFDDLPEARWGSGGSQAIEFMYSPAPEVPARPLAKIASGGEISRVMLALKTVLGPADAAATLVFDEVDAGIGGATGTAIGERLARLAERHQVIVVTHLAQVASFAHDHLVVRKVLDHGRTATVVEPVRGAARTAEVARMLSGATSDTALEHARELIRANAPSPLGAPYDPTDRSSAPAGY